MRRQIEGRRAGEMSNSIAPEIDNNISGQFHSIDYSLFEEEENSEWEIQKEA